MNKKNILYVFLLCYHSTIISDAITFHRYLSANYDHFSGNISRAKNWYQILFSSNPSTYSYKGYLHLLFDTHQYNTIVELIPSLDAKFEKDADIQLIFALSLEKCNKINDADNRLIKLSNSFKSNSEITLRTTQTYLRRKEPENALLTIDAFLNNSPRKPHNFIFYFLKSQIHLQLGQLSPALDNIVICLDIHPRFDKGWLLFATLQEQKGEIQKALQGYTTFLELFGKNDSVEQHLFSFVLKHKTNEHCQSFHKSYFDQASTLFNQKKYHAALRCLNQFLVLQPGHYEACLLKIQILAQLKEYKKIVEELSLDKEINKTLQLWPKNIYLLHHHNIKKEDVIAMLETLYNIHSDNYWFALYAADLCIHDKQHEKAISLLNKALESSKDNALNAQVYHQMGILSYEMNNYAGMILYLEKGYALNKHNDHLNNTLAYYWATKGKDIQKAQFFFDQISALKNTNPCFLDTQALIFYKQRDYIKAQTILEQLSDQHNPTTLLRLAKIYYKLNHKNKALDLSKKISLYTVTDKEKKHLDKLQLLLASND